MKLGEFPMASKDCDKALELNPSFGKPFVFLACFSWTTHSLTVMLTVKAYTRKGHCQFFMKQYHKCLETYEQGLKVDPDNEELNEGLRRTMEAISRRQGATNEAEDKEAMAAAANDPEIQRIISDPMMKNVLAELSTNPAAAQGYDGLHNDTIQ